MTMRNPLHSSNGVEHYTPSYIVEAARYALGGSIYFDPASCDFANAAVNAAVFCSKGGLEVSNWKGPCFLNPPGRSPTNPSGAGPWWQKLAKTWEEDNDFSAIYIGYSLEQLQTLQSWGPWHPLDYALVCVPSKRICFDVEAKALRARLLSERRAVTDVKRIEQLQAKIVAVDAAIERGEVRVAGDNPTHGNFIVMLPKNYVIEGPRFREAFEKIGRCS